MTTQAETLKALEELAQFDMKKSASIVFKTKLVERLIRRGWFRETAEQLAREMPVHLPATMSSKFLEKAAEHYAVMFERVRAAYFDAQWDEVDKATIAHASSCAFVQG